MAPRAEPIPTTEYDAVLAAAQCYFDSLKTADRGLLEEAFHDDAILAGWFLNGIQSEGSYRDLHDYYEAHGPSVDINTRADVMHIAPTAAVVKADMEGTPGNPYIDLLGLIKVDGKWKILMKASRECRKPSVG
ncbi:unnamed protein product [Clonostachys rosea]|uniref:SnoaL-like domain-containing protein n=1 Tax=Bionectria ochroleuca TaxID=29856 RepID=A0ABY6UWB8_BIOOC|nr:unnamed protein product [Clonostachys rosea]